MDRLPRDLTSFFQPKAIAIVGASKDFTTIGGKPVRNLLAHGYKGKLHLVNPRYTEIEGVACYPSLDDIPGDLELVLIAVSKKRIVEVIHQCGKKKVKFVTVFGAGFAEVGDEGAMLQREVIDLCQSYGIRLCGPNCIGSINVRNSIPMGFSNAFEKESFIAGPIGLVSQSGALGYATFAMAQAEGLGFSYVANTGNQADLTTLDFLEFLVTDPHTRVLSAYMEGIPDGARLKRLAQEAVQQHKPLIILKSGRSDIGKKAAMSHTGSLAGSEQAFQAVAKQFGMTLVKDTDDLLDAYKIFARGKTASGKKVAVISTSGATGILSADHCAELGLEMAVLSEETLGRMKAILPDFASSVNPVDITAQALNERDIFRQCLDIVISAPEVDALVVTTTFAGRLVLKMMEEVIEADQASPKPVLVTLQGPDELVGAAQKKLFAAGVPTYLSVSRTIAALKQLVDHSGFIALNSCSSGKGVSLSSADSEAGQDEIFSLKQEMNEVEVKELLRLSGIPVPKGKIAATREEVHELVNGLSFPLAAKIVSKHITHKSDVGGVVLSINDTNEAMKAFDEIIVNVKRHKPDADIEGILFEEMVSAPFLEAIVGVKRDPQFGPMMVCGLGGIFVEVLKDVAWRNAPLSEKEAHEMISELKAYPVFQGIRGKEAYDVEAFAEAMMRISNLGVKLGEQLEEIEINPLIVRPKGQGVMALDGLIVNGHS